MDKTEPKTKQSPINPEFVERYQLELQKNPRSRVFAPLAEAYRKMGLHAEGLRICKLGLQANQDFAGGYVAYAKLLLETRDFEEALIQLQSAVRLSADNLLAQSLMGEVLLELRQPKEALKAFKMVLFLNPNDEKALSAVRKWEFLTADEFDDEVFQMHPVFKTDPQLPVPPREFGARSPAITKDQPFEERRQKDIDRAISLADAFTIRNDLPSAIEILENAHRALGGAVEIEHRLQLLARRTQVTPAQTETAFDDALPQESELELAVENEPEFYAGSPAQSEASHQEPDPSREARLRLFLQRINERRFPL
jgi:tetratricopeptide (TPR) repeat protein